MTRFVSLFRLWGARAASPAILFYLLPLLMLILIGGTVAQKYVGLYVAVRTFFGSPFLWLYGYVPLPGGLLVLGLLSLNLLAKFLFKSEWRWPRVGVILAHGGAVLLLLGGLGTALLAEEGSLTLAEGQQRHTLEDYHQRMLVLLEDGTAIDGLDPRSLTAGRSLFANSLPFTLTVAESCRNCQITRRTEGADDLRSMARGMQLSPASLNKNDEANVGGLTLTVHGLGAADDGTYLVFEGGPLVQFKTQDHLYELAYSKAQRELPFAVKLVDVVRRDHPGTDMPAAYYSDVLAQDGAASWPVRIEMNKPLHHRGYTLYQSGYFATPEGEVTVLAVVHNRLRLLPYVATALMAAGLLLHLLLMLRERRP